VIPHTVPLMGHVIQVFIIPKDQWPHGEETAGIWLPLEHQIHIYDGLDDSNKIHTFFHELLHACLDCMNHKLSRNEVFVDQLGGLLHQALVGATYAKPKRARKRASTKK